MKHFLTICIFCLLVHYNHAQNFSTAYAEEMKFKKGTIGLDIIAADKSGVYFSQLRGSSSSTKLIKIDQSFTVVFEKDYDNKMKDRLYETFAYLADKMFLFTRDYNKKQKTLTIACIQIDKTTGELIDTWKDIAVYKKENEKDEIRIDIRPMVNQTGYIVTTSVESADNLKIHTQTLDVNAQPKISSTINIEFAPKLYELEDIKISKTNSIILLGKEYEEVETLKKKKKVKTIAFKQYLIGFYTVAGEKITNVPVSTNEKFALGAKLIEQPTGEILLAGFYSNTIKKDALSGFFINKIDPVSGTILSSTTKEMSTSMLGNFKEEDEPETDSKEKSAKKLAGKQEDSTEESLPNNFIIRTADVNPADNSIIITAEVMRYSTYHFTQTEWTGSGNTRTMKTSYYDRHLFYNNDILIINADKGGKVNWFNLIHKSQLETYVTYSFGGDPYYELRKNYAGMFSSSLFPYYSSYKTMFYKNNLLLIYNDNIKNKNTLGIKDDIYTIANFSNHSNTYAIIIDLATGKMTKKSIASNDEETVIMPRHSYIFGNNIFAPSWKTRLIGKTTFKLARITVK